MRPCRRDGICPGLAKQVGLPTLENEWVEVRVPGMGNSKTQGGPAVLADVEASSSVRRNGWSGQAQGRVHLDFELELFLSREMTTARTVGAGGGGVESSWETDVGAAAATLTAKRLCLWVRGSPVTWHCRDRWGGGAGEVMTNTNSLTPVG